MTDTPGPEMLTRKEWRERGYIVPSTADPDKVEYFRRGRYEAERHLFCFQQVRPVSEQRAKAAKKGVSTRMRNMEEAMRTVPLTIVRGKSNHEIYRLARLSHGGNYGGIPGPFYWSNRKARNAIRHGLTNYEAQWSLINRGQTAEWAYDTLRERIDELVDEAYPQFAAEEPEIPESAVRTEA